MKIFHKDMQQILYELFVKYKFNKEKAELLAYTFTQSTLDGVSSHGINRVPLFIEHIKKGIVKTNTEAEPIASFGNIERWDGHLGAGIINATKCTDRAIALAKEHGMGMVALRNTNHWMRGGSYGKRAAEANCISILFTNTKPNMPPWGGKDSRIGNNPFVISIPRAKGNIVLDMALSQFSFGKINDYRLKNKTLPFYGGWDTNNELSKDPNKILSKERGLPIGYWKGSALSMVLDMLATVLSAGNSTAKISTEAIETAISQVYICIYLQVFNDKGLEQRLLNEIIEFTRNVEPMYPEDHIYYPGERSAKTREKKLKDGLIVNDEIWQKILAYLN
ncbi:3-dehydro-L-gulonate 2-dehydrogenase [uncultured Winogradskyella sp.]|uniref:3-dehydro-L-gulonate 2-dehydrogenase n=1 Tax=uncultured Winogradskyella sp. TaxID=395353 RepID=UPI00260FB811|nr:3-dehydro-L-gulonate 2-dehydrogenase [uncultured Winogradskyella sp.]